MDLQLGFALLCGSHFPLSLFSLDFPNNVASSIKRHLAHFPPRFCILHQAFPSCPAMDAGLVDKPSGFSDIIKNT
jgi:hypothetical protein